MMYWWIIGASVVGYLVYKRRFNWSLIILIALTIGLGLLTGISPVPHPVSLPSVEPSRLVNAIDLALGAACSVRLEFILFGVEGPSIGLPESLCTILGLLNTVWGRLPIVLAIYNTFVIILDNWAWFWIIGLVAYIWDEDFGLGLVLIPYIAYILALEMRPLVLGLVGLGFTGSGIYLTYITSMRPVAFTGTAIGYTTSLSLSFNPVNITGVIFQWHYLGYNVSEYYVGLPLSLHIGYILIQPLLNYTPITCWGDYCGGYLIMRANTTYTITSLPNGTVIITMNRILNRTIWLEAWLFTRSYTTNCTGVFRPDYNYSLVNVGWINSLVKSIDNRTVVPNDSAVGYIQGFLNAYAFNKSCIVRIIGNTGNRWIASANYAYTPALEYITGREDLYKRMNGIVTAAIVISSIGVLAGVSLEFLTITGILGRVFKLITTRLPE